MSEVQTKKKNEISTNLFEADAGQGLNMTQEDLALPFLKVLGQLSPECNKRDAKHVEGAEPGMIINTVTGEVYDGVKGIDVVPVHYKSCLLYTSPSPRDGLLSRMPSSA